MSIVMDQDMSIAWYHMRILCAVKYNVIYSFIYKRDQPYRPLKHLRQATFLVTAKDESSTSSEASVVIEVTASKWT